MLLSFDKYVLNNIDSYCGPEKNPDPFPSIVSLDRSVYTSENNINRKMVFPPKLLDSSSLVTTYTIL